ncbi:UNVERIFIED_CONTAM: hypothetical protein K2H54_017279 [Gekko kuhli]
MARPSQKLHPGIAQHRVQGLILINLQKSFNCCTPLAAPGQVRLHKKPRKRKHETFTVEEERAQKSSLQVTALMVVLLGSTRIWHYLIYSREERGPCCQARPGACLT